MSNSTKTLNLTTLLKFLPKRLRNSQKGDFGHVLVIGGDHGMAGAPRMAGEAAARVGAGLISIATHPEHIDIISSERPELMAHGVKASKDLESLLKRATVIAIGPGLGQSTWSQQLFKKVLSTPQSKVVDADALNLLAKKSLHRDDWILTPHPGEAARLLKCSTAKIQKNRINAANDLQKKYGGVIVLKGAGTIVIGPDQKPAICKAGNPGMASGGMGDVLTGVIAGLLAQGLTLKQAAELGVCLHATAGDLAAKEGKRGLLALDLMPYLRNLVNPS